MKLNLHFKITKGEQNMTNELRESIIWHFQQGYTLKRTWEIKQWESPKLKLKDVQEIFDELNSMIPKAGVRREVLTA
ncbi:hypothetical protein AB3N59_20430 (plasmid) [Leptospira sp. WS92.C1]